MALALLAMWGLKRHYAEARAEDLWWILSPTSRVVGFLTSADFTFEAGQGYLSRERLFVIEKSCAGINFMIAALGMLAYAWRCRVETWTSTVMVLALSLGASYAAAVIVNATRITVAMWLAANPVPPFGLSAAQLHRVEGIIVYFGGLMLLYESAGRFDRSTPCAALRSR
jgi:exosortase K